MRLGTKFVLLIVGTLAMPLIALSLVALFAFTGYPNSLGPTQSIRTMLALSDLRHRKVDPVQVPPIMRVAAPDSDFLVFDQDQQLVYSSLRSDSLVEYLLDPRRQTILFSHFTLRAMDGRSFSIAIGFSSDNSPRPWQGGLAFLVVMGSLVGFMSLMSLFIIRSINSSIARLEEGTRRISAGDLDFELPVSGSDRIASLTRSFEDMRRRVRQDAEARSRFIMSVSHDLKTPLSSIAGYLDAIGDGMARTPVQMKKYLAILRDKTGILEGRISQLIDYVKLETGEWRRSRETVRLAPFLREAMTVFGTEAEARGYAFSFSINLPEDAAASMEPDLVYRALENLVQNAFHYSEPGTTVRIEAGREPSCAFLRILNRGTIVEEHLPFIFEPFYRGTRSRREEGFGLGLAVVKWIASSHGWTVDAASRGGETSFTIRIPLDPAPLAK